MTRFIIFLLGVAVLTGGGFWLAQKQGMVSSLPSFFFQTLFFLTFGTVLLYRYLINVKKPGLFVQLYLLTMAIKLIAYGAYCWLMITEDKAGAMLNVVFFMVVYIVFTGLEIGFLFHKISSTQTPE